MIVTNRALFEKKKEESMGNIFISGKRRKNGTRRFQLGMDFLEQWCSEMLQKSGYR